jgi:uncharacterized protein (UPF0548 family)
MFLLTKPSTEFVREYLSAQQSASFSYSEVGASRNIAPGGYTVDHNRIQLGQGADTFERAIRAVKTWKMFDIPWLELYWPTAPTEVGATVAVLVRHMKFWSLNFCRITYVIEEHDPRELYGFAYGTLSDHAEVGEERFSVEYDPRDQSVWYDLYAFSRPRPLVRVAYPLARMLQRRFIKDSKGAMLRAIQHASMVNLKAGG